MHINYIFDNGIKSLSVEGFRWVVVSSECNDTEITLAHIDTDGNAVAPGVKTITIFAGSSEENDRLFAEKPDVARAYQEYMKYVVYCNDMGKHYELEESKKHKDILDAGYEYIESIDTWIAPDGSLTNF